MIDDPAGNSGSAFCSRKRMLMLQIKNEEQFFSAAS
jgi:hypothetical protein